MPDTSRSTSRSGGAPDQRQRPNILLIVSDDHGYGDLGLRGIDPEVSTPHLDALAASGRLYDNAYVTAPICSPSRAGLIAGQYQERWGAHWFTDSAMPPRAVPSLAELLGERGYRTGYFGKIHYGQDKPGDRACPPHHGFDTSFYGVAALSMGRLHYLHHSRAHEEAYGEAAKRHGVSPMWVGEGKETWEVDCERHLTEEFVQRAIDFVGRGSAATPRADGRTGAYGATGADGGAGVDDATWSDAGAGLDDASADSPFFAMVAFNAVHNFTWQLPQHELDARGLPSHPDFDAETNDYLDWYDGAVEPNLENGRAYYLAQLEIMDREIGRLMAHLEETGQRENTVVVYMTDNGGSHCNYGRNTPLEGSKYTLYEGGVRTPLIISWPCATEPGSVSKALVSSLDLMPTFIGASGVPLGAEDVCDGIDFRDSMRDPEAPVHDVLHFDTGFQWAVRTRDWKLRFVDPECRARASILQVEHTDIGSGMQLSPATDDLAGLDETRDVSAEHPEALGHLQQLHAAWREEMEASAAHLA